MMIVVSMTSWPKRIGNCKTVIKSLLNQEVMPDFIELNLSIEEFPNKEFDLPEELTELIYNNKCIEINWVSGNTGVFKKIIPTLKKFYGKDYYLLSVDDDYVYRNDYIKMMIEHLNKNNGADSFSLSGSIIIGNRTIYRSSCFEPDFWEKLTKEIIDTRIDDMYITHYLISKHKKTTNYDPLNINEIRTPFNPVFPNSHNTKTGEYSIEDINKARDVISKINFK